MRPLIKNQAPRFKMPKSARLLGDERFDEYLRACDDEALEHERSPAVRTAILHFQFGFQRWELLLLAETTPRIWRNAIAAHNFGRLPGTIGRPRYISTDYEKSLIEAMTSFSNAENPQTVSRMRTLVCIILSDYLFPIV